MAEAQIQKRQTAQKTSIRNLNEGTYIKDEGEQNHFLTPNGKIHRTNIIGVIVNNDSAENFSTMVLDDNTGQINIKSFDNNTDIKTFHIGRIVQIIAKPREYNGEKYLTPEIIKEVDKKWFYVRQKELQTLEKREKPHVEARKENKPTNTEERKTETKIEKIIEQKIEDIKPKKETINEMPKSEPAKVSAHEKILSLIMNMDEGKGVPIEEIILASGLKNAEEIITNLIEEGEIFELRPGILKTI